MFNGTKDRFEKGTACNVHLPSCEPIFRDNAMPVSKDIYMGIHILISFRTMLVSPLRGYSALIGSLTTATF